MTIVRTVAAARAFGECCQRQLFVRSTASKEGVPNEQRVRQRKLPAKQETKPAQAIQLTEGNACTKNNRKKTNWRITIRTKTQRKQNKSKANCSVTCARSLTAVILGKQSTASVSSANLRAEVETFKLFRKWCIEACQEVTLHALRRHQHWLLLLVLGFFGRGRSRSWLAARLSRVCNHIPLNTHHKSEGD